jgi:hypothetical protein
MTTAPIPVLSLHEPWASLIMFGAKRYETRTWSCPRSMLNRPIALHAARKLEGRLGTSRTIGEFELRRDRAGYMLGHPRLSWPYRLNPGAIIGIVTITASIPMVHSIPYARTSNPWKAHHSHGAENPVIDLDLDDSPVARPWLSTFDRWADDGSDERSALSIASEAPYGSWVHGNHAWQLGTVKRLLRPVPFTGGQGFSRTWTPTPDQLAGLVDVPAWTT